MYVPWSYTVQLNYNFTLVYNLLMRNSSDTYGHLVSKLQWEFNLISICVYVAGFVKRSLPHIFKVGNKTIFYVIFSHLFIIYLQETQVMLVGILWANHSGDLTCYIFVHIIYANTNQKPCSRMSIIWGNQNKNAMECSPDPYFQPNDKRKQAVWLRETISTRPYFFRSD